MAQRDSFEFAARRLRALQYLELLILQNAFDGPQPVRPFRMARGSEMLKTGRMRDEQGRHELSSRRSGDPRQAETMQPSSGKEQRQYFLQPVNHLTCDHSRPRYHFMANPDTEICP